MKISVVVCTYNRCEDLRRALQSLILQDFPATDYEILVVDNNSIDKTKDVVGNFLKISSSNVKYVFETAQGLSHARNRGIKEAKGEIISFIDDDVIVAKDWLTETKKAFDIYKAAYISGRVLIKDKIEKPDWWDEQYNMILGEFDRGDAVIFVNERYAGIIGIGANMSFDRKVFDKYGFFRTDLGRIGKSLLMGEETEFCRRLKEHGELMIYYPNAVVCHCPNINRMTKKYVRRWYFRIGEWSLLEDISYRRVTLKTLRNIPKWKFKLPIKDLLKAFILILNGRHKEGFYNELKSIFFFGYIYGLFKEFFVT